MTVSPDYVIDYQGGTRRAALNGVFRLESTQAYERLFEALRVEMSVSSERFTLDLSGVVFMNSSGIHALAGLVLAARAASVPLRIVSDPTSAWQRKTIASLRLLSGGLELTNDPGSSGA